jgi:signal transduction histidine kinase
MLETQRLNGLGVLAGGVAHDFNNLLTSILGNASLARMDLTPAQDKAHDALLNVERASLRAAGLCKELLAYAGKGRVVVREIELGTLINETACLLEVSIGRHISLRLQIAPGLPVFMGDASQIRQVLTNLAINAAEAIGDRPGVITVTADRAWVTPEQRNGQSIADEKLPAGEYVTLEVTDNGCGMTADVKANIFDPFFTTKFTGRGLGLAAVRGILRVHKAGVSFHSEVGVGTTFKLFFPAANNQKTA